MRPYLQGREAYKDKKNIHECPFAMGTTEATEWSNGYFDAQLEDELARRGNT